MKRPLPRGLVKSAIYLAVGFLLWRMFVVLMPDAFVRLPSERSPNLVGEWYVERYGTFRHYIFKPDGSGEIWTPGRPVTELRWGTYGDRLMLKYRNNELWTAPIYLVKMEGGKITLDPLGAGRAMVLTKDHPKQISLP